MKRREFSSGASVMAMFATAVLKFDMVSNQHVRVISSATGADSHLFSVGDLCHGPHGMYQIVADATLRPNDATVLALPKTGRQAVLQPHETLRDFAAVQADTRPPEYFAEGDLVRTAAGYNYEVANARTLDAHVTTDGGVNLNVVADQDGYYPVEAFGFQGTGAPGDLARLQTAADFTPQLRFQARTYEFGEIVRTPNGYGSHKWCCVLANKSIAWRSTGTTTLRISDALQNTPQDDDITIVFVENQNDFSAPGFVFDENAKRQGFGAPFACYGVLRISVDGVTTLRAQPARIGASPMRLSGEVMGRISCYEGRGTFVVGSKPGGALVYKQFSAYVENSRGGVNIEAENVDKLVGLDHRVDFAGIDQIVGRSIDAARTDGIDTDACLLRVADGAKRVHVGLIHGNGIRAKGPSQIATCLSFRAGQDGNACELVQVGQIYARDCQQAIYSEAVATPLGQIQSGPVFVDNARFGIQALKTDASANGYIDGIFVERLDGKINDPLSPSTGNGEGTAVQLVTSTAPSSRPPVVKNFLLGGGNVTVRKRAFDVSGVERFEVRNFSCTAHRHTNPSGNSAGNVYNAIEADEIVLDAVTLRGFAGTSAPLELRPKVSCRLTGLDITANGSNGALFFNGSGMVILDGCIFRGASNALVFRPMSGTFNAASDVNMSMDLITVPGHPFRHGERVLYTAGAIAIGGLTNGATYYVLWVSEDTIRLSQTLRGAAIDLTSAGSGTATLKKALDVRALNTRNECTRLETTAVNAISFAASGSW